MLCRVEFLESLNGPTTGANAPAGSLATWIPEAALSGGSVWVCNSESNRVSKRAVSSASENRDGFTRITDGLRPGEWVVLAPTNLRDGKRVTPNLVQQ